MLQIQQEHRRTPHSSCKVPEGDKSGYLHPESGEESLCEVLLRSRCFCNARFGRSRLYTRAVPFLPEENLQYDLQTDQSSEGNLKNADLITGYWHDIPRSYYVNIPMKHRMSLVTIVYHVGTADYPDMDISEPQVYSKNNSVRFFRDPDQGKFVMNTPSGNPDWVKACKHDDGMFSAIVIPGSYKTDEIFVKFKIGDKNFHAKMRSNTEFQEGHRYTYKLDVGKDKVELTRISIDNMTGWTNEEELK